ncbi:MAG: hypothetical protein ACJAVI_003362 [Candidatus Azotimanducaceae bacterium]
MRGIDVVQESLFAITGFIAARAASRGVMSAAKLAEEKLQGILPPNSNVKEQNCRRRALKKPSLLYRSSNIFLLAMRTLGLNVSGR